VVIPKKKETSWIGKKIRNEIKGESPGEKEGASSPKKRQPISAFNFKNQGGGRIGDETQIP